ncbi:hypothetical protein [Streptomyces chartreusis]|uniref:hypothetical protein n=1 Tax=Streptomyces chartreusis TaxID=1969 RepID=UPI00363C1217
MHTDIAFLPVIVRAPSRQHPPLAGVDPHAVRIAPASHLTDHDLVVGYAEEVTDESREARDTDPDATRIFNGEFFRRPYTVNGHNIDSDGWVSLRSDCWVWRSGALVLYVPRDYC